MRKWINLVESNSFSDAVKAMSAHDAASDTSGWGYSIEGDPFEITDEHAMEMRTNLEAMLAKNNVVFRYMLLLPADLHRYLAGPLGTFWCHDWDINVESLTGWDSAPDGAELYRLTAAVNPVDVDMVRSVVQNLACPWEKEIKVNPGSKLDLRGVDLLPNSDPDARPVRQHIAAGLRIA